MTEIDNLEEIVIKDSPLKKELIDKIPNRKVILKDKKLKIIIPEQEETPIDEEQEVTPPQIEKQRKPRTQAQIDAFKKVRDKKMENARLREQERKLLLDQQQKDLEEKIIKKAVSIKKKQIKKEAVLEEISDDDTPIEVIKEIKKRIPHVAPVKPVFKIKFV